MPEKEDQDSMDTLSLSSHSSGVYDSHAENEKTTKPLAKRIIKVVAKVALALSLPVVYVLALPVAPFYIAGKRCHQGIMNSPIDERTDKRRIDKAELTKNFFKDLGLATLFFPFAPAGLTQKIWKAGSDSLERFCPSESKDDSAYV